jgi:hypothetical protein
VVRHLTLAVLILSAAFIGPAAAQRDWGRGPGPGPGRGAPPPAAFELIDTQAVDSREDRIVFHVGRREGRFLAIKFRSVNDRMLLGGVEIEFANRERQTLKLIDRLEPGDESQVIDLKGEARRIETVTLWKRPSWRPGRASVELIGMEERDRGPPPGDFELVASETADARDDRIVFRVGRGEGAFTAIKFRAVNDRLLIGGIEIQFGNGERQALRLVAKLEPGQESPAIDLAGERRRIETVTLWKRQSWRPGRVTVDLGAKQERGHGGPPGGPRGWVLLATQMADLLVKDRDQVILGERFGRFKAVRLAAKQGDVRIYGVRVVYGNGEIEDLPVSAQLKQGQTTPPFDLKGQGRFIDRIEMKYRSKLTLKGPGIIEVWGLY